MKIRTASLMHFHAILGSEIGTDVLPRSFGTVQSAETIVQISNSIPLKDDYLHCVSRWVSYCTCCHLLNLGNCLQVLLAVCLLYQLLWQVTTHHLEFRLCYKKMSKWAIWWILGKILKANCERQSQQSPTKFQERGCNTVKSNFLLCVQMQGLLVSIVHYTKNQVSLLWHDLDKFTDWWY